MLGENVVRGAVTAAAAVVAGLVVSVIPAQGTPGAVAAAGGVAGTDTSTSTATDTTPTPTPTETTPTPTPTGTVPPPDTRLLPDLVAVPASELSIHLNKKTGIRAVDFKPRCLGMRGLSNTEVMKQRGDVEQFRVEFQVLTGALHRSEQKDTNRVVEQHLGFVLSHQFGGFPRDLAIRNSNTGNHAGLLIVMRLASRAPSSTRTRRHGRRALGRRAVASEFFGSVRQPSRSPLAACCGSRSPGDCRRSSGRSRW